MQFGDRFIDLICNHLGISRSPEPIPEVSLTQTNNVNNTEFPYIERHKQLDNNIYEPWTNEADNALRFLYKQGKSVSELADIFNRTVGAIRSRLRKLGELL